MLPRRGSVAKRLPSTVNRQPSSRSVVQRLPSTNYQPPSLLTYDLRLLLTGLA
ncbi:hypothetical protein [Scytonema millei]|uniref:Uncharacterized protein n=1 Tax=Scytonema millei VB511283 TaxID=1245923 RepID=A0A9X5E4L7_9CYAN|nr:hypothetical protein [Scytonema millei]NHC35255.1 hypothetical protein [Scytonema millei VB511283]